MQADIEPRRKLAAILSADAAGYSRLMGEDEAATVATLNAYREVFARFIAQHQGRVVDTAGDSVLAMFDSVVEAVQCAAELQQELTAKNAPLPEARRMEFRVGVNLGDVIEQADGSIYGDGVNIAARLQALAHPGEIYLSGTAYDQIKNKISMAVESLGAKSVKNIAEPIRVYRLRGDGIAAPRLLIPIKKLSGHWRTFAAILVVSLAVGAVAWWQTSRGPQSSGEPVAAAPVGVTVAVLPFANMSGDPGQEFFADGITEQIITELARFRDLSVIARNSTFSYKGKAVDVRQVGKELGARYIVEGSVQRRADLVRVTVQLLDARSGAHLWAETYERDLKRTKVFGIQDDITGRVVTAIGDAHGAISRATFDASSSKGTESLDAYECVLRYTSYYRALSPTLHARVRDCLERAVKLSPSYTEAWAALADAYTEEYSNEFNPRPDSLSRALRAAQYAVKLGPASPDAYMSLAKVHFFLRDKDAFVAAAERAMALNPNYVDVLASYGLYWIYLHFDDPVQRAHGVEAIRKAIALNPIYPTWYHFGIAWHYYRSEDYAAALAEAKKIDMPDYFWTHLVLATSYGAMDRTDEARASVARLLELYPDFPKTARQEWRKWNFPESMIDKNVRNLRRAGLDIPEGG